MKETINEMSVYDEKTERTIQPKIYSGAWMTLVATIASIAVFLLPTESLALPLSFLFSLIALVVGYRSLKVIHKNPELFIGRWIVIPSLIISVLVFLVNIAVLTVFFFIPEEEGEKIIITSDEDAIAFADHLRSDLSQNKPELAQPFDGALVMTLNLDEMNSLGLTKQEWFKGDETFYIVSWEIAAGSLVKLCSTAFATDGNVALEPSCAVTEVEAEETAEEKESNA